MVKEVDTAQLGTTRSRWQRTKHPHSRGSDTERRIQCRDGRVAATKRELTNGTREDIDGGRWMRLLSCAQPLGSGSGEAELGSRQGRKEWIGPEAQKASPKKKDFQTAEEGLWVAGCCRPLVEKVGELRGT